MCYVTTSCLLLDFLQFFCFHGVTAPSGSGSSHFQGFMIALRHITFCRIPLDKWSVQCRDLYLTTYNTHKRWPYVPCRTWNHISSKQATDFSMVLNSNSNQKGSLLSTEWYLMMLGLLVKTEVPVDHSAYICYYFDHAVYVSWSCGGQHKPHQAQTML
jgi:hypothetical protein